MTDEINDALDILQELGGVMAKENCPLAQVLLDGGHVVEGDPDKFGRKTIKLIPLTLSMPSPGPGSDLNPGNIRAIIDQLSGVSVSAVDQHRLDKETHLRSLRIRWEKYKFSADGSYLSLLEGAIPPLSESVLERFRTAAQDFTPSEMRQGIRNKYLRTDTGRMSSQDYLKNPWAFLRAQAKLTHFGLEYPKNPETPEPRLFFTGNDADTPPLQIETRVLKARNRSDFKMDWSDLDEYFQFGCAREAPTVGETSLVPHQTTPGPNSVNVPLPRVTRRKKGQPLFSRALSEALFRFCDSVRSKSVLDHHLRMCDPAWERGCDVCPQDSLELAQSVSKNPCGESVPLHGGDSMSLQHVGFSEGAVSAIPQQMAVPQIEQVALEQMAALARMGIVHTTHDSITTYATSDISLKLHEMYKEIAAKQFPSGGKTTWDPVAVDLPMKRDYGPGFRSVHDMVAFHSKHREDRVKKRDPEISFERRSALFSPGDLTWENFVSQVIEFSPSVEQRFAAPWEVHFTWDNGRSHIDRLAATKWANAYADKLWSDLSRNTGCLAKISAHNRPTHQASIAIRVSPQGGMRVIKNRIGYSGQRVLAPTE